MKNVNELYDNLCKAGGLNFRICGHNVTVTKAESGYDVTRNGYARRITGKEDLLDALDSLNREEAYFSYEDELFPEDIPA